MAITVGIFGESGDGKTSSIIVTPDGHCMETKEFANGWPAGVIDPATTVYINADKKAPPFPFGLWPKDNYVESSNPDTILKVVKGAGAAGTPIKRIIVDTINGIMVDTEMTAQSKITYDKWMDLAKDIYALIQTANGLRNDLIVYLLGHVTIYTNVDGNESKCLITNGRKLEKIKLESKMPIVLFTHIEQKVQGDNTFHFETQKNRSTGKTPPGMFETFLVPNSMLMVDQKIREFYHI